MQDKENVKKLHCFVWFQYIHKNTKCVCESQASGVHQKPRPAENPTVQALHWELSAPYRVLHHRVQHHSWCDVREMLLWVGNTFWFFLSGFLVWLNSVIRLWSAGWSDRGPWDHGGWHHRCSWLGGWHLFFVSLHAAYRVPQPHHAVQGDFPQQVHPVWCCHRLPPLPGHDGRRPLRLVWSSNSCIS